MHCADIRCCSWQLGLSFCYNVIPSCCIIDMQASIRIALLKKYCKNNFLLEHGNYQKPGSIVGRDSKYFNKHGCYFLCWLSPYMLTFAPRYNNIAIIRPTMHPSYSSNFIYVNAKFSMLVSVSK